MSDVTSPRRIAQPRSRLGGVVKNLSIAYQSVRPIVDNPAVRVIAGGIHRGVKRGADSILEARDRFFNSWIETRQSRDDGLIIKRFKRLPIDTKTSSNPYAQRRDPLPVAYLRSLPKDQFRWTDDAKTYLGEKNHTLVIHFVSEFIAGMQGNCFLRFDGIQNMVDPCEVPDEVSTAIRAYSKNEALSIVLHNHLIKQEMEGSFTEDDDREKRHRKSSEKLIQDLFLFQRIHEEVYSKEGRLTVHKACGLKPYGPLEYPYEKFGQTALIAHFHLMGCIHVLKFLLSQRDAFNQIFLAETVGGIIADLDAIHKDEPAPSYVDWPGKNHRDCPGSYPEDVMDNLLFETIPERDFEPTRLWDHQHLSPSKHITANNYDTPHRNAMQKNEIYYDENGEARAKKGHLKKENAGPAQKKRARFMSSPVAWYKPSTNVPLQKKELEAPSTLFQSITPAPAVETAQQTVVDRPNPDSTSNMQQVDKLVEQLAKNPIYSRQRPSKYKNIDDFFAHDDEGPFGKGLSLKISTEKAEDLEIREQLEQEGSYRAAQEVKRIAAEERRLAEEARLKAEEERRLAEQRRRDEEDRRLTETGELRAPHRAIIPNLSTEWTDKVMQTLHARSNAELAKTPEGLPLTKRDFATVVRPNEWLNDEIVNASLQHFGNYVNQKAGIKNTRVRAPKIHVFNSFVGKNLCDNRPPTERVLRRAGIRKDNFLDIETILFPLCRGSHWTVLAVRPKHRKIYHLDSLSSHPNQGLIALVDNWMREVLQEAYIDEDWKVETLASPRQSNSDDCGVHTITNGICLGLGIEPSAHDASMMPQQRLHVAAVLLNGGFSQDLTLDGI